MKNIITSTWDGTENNNHECPYVVHDYCTKYGKKPIDTVGIRSCLVTVESGDDPSCVECFCNMIINAGYDVIMFNISLIGAALIYHIRYSEECKKHGYEEISGLYDDTIIFAKSV